MLTNRQKSWITLGIFILAASIVFIVLPRPDARRLHYEVGKPWSENQLLAPFAIPIYLDDDALKVKVDSVEQAVGTIYKVDDAPLKELVKTINSANLDEAKKDALTKCARKVYANGVASKEDFTRIKQSGEEGILVHNSNTTFQASKICSASEAYTSLCNVDKNLDLEFLSQYMRPNVVADKEKTQQAVEEQTRRFYAAQGVIQEGATIINRGDIVSPAIAKVLDTYQEELDKVSSRGNLSSINITLGQILLSIVVMAMLYSFLKIFRPHYLTQLGRLVCLLMLIDLFFVCGVIMAANFASGIYIVPFVILPILVVVFYDTVTAIVAMVIEIALCAAFAPYPFEFMLVELAGGMVAVCSLRTLARRSQLLNTAVLIFFAYVVAYVAVELSQVANLSSFSWKLIGFFAVNMVLTSFAYILIFVLEKLFGFTSVVTLVELSDINHPLIRELSVECPGTFQHSMAIGNLVTEAAHRIGANVQLVRAGALYHDIGKIDNPAFFTENQHGVNPHNTLNDPMLSARMIIGHVTSGLKKAEKYNLPGVIRDMIAQHHGKGTVRYFYTTYCNAHPDIDVDPTPFSYPGPNPQSKEASLLMMADAVEAASRSLTEHTPEALTALVDKIIDTQVNEGLHRESPLSFQDISIIKKAFVESLRTMYHTRVAYPERKKREEGEKPAETSTPSTPQTDSSAK